VGDINIATVDSLKALDPNRPIREADIVDVRFFGRYRGQGGHGGKSRKCCLMTDTVEKGLVIFGEQ